MTILNLATETATMRRRAADGTGYVVHPTNPSITITRPAPAGPDIALEYSIQAPATAWVCVAVGAALDLLPNDELTHGGAVYVLVGVGPWTMQSGQLYQLTMRKPEGD